MNFFGWVFLVLSWGVILGLLGYCLYRVLSSETD